MKNTEKQNLINTLVDTKNPKDRFKKLVAILIGNKDATPAQKRYYNSCGFSETNLKTLEYDLQKIANITPSDLNTAKKKVKAVKVEASKPQLSAELQEALKSIDLENIKYQDLKKVAKEVSDILEIKPKSQTGDDLKAFLKGLIPGETEKPEQPLSEELLILLRTSDEEAEKIVKFREEYPFLGDADCPDKLKILAADKITAHNNYVEARAQLKALYKAGASAEELFKQAQAAVDNFKTNLEIWDELNYYNEHKAILGKHPIFADEMLNEKLDSMSEEKLKARKKNLASYISKDTKKLSKIEDPEKKKAAEAKIKEWKEEHDAIVKRLDKSEA